MLTGDGKGILTNNQLTYLYNAVDNIIERLPEKALNQLLEGYGNDVDTMLREMVHQSEKALYLGRTMDSESLSYVDNVKASMDNTLKILSLNYFITTMLPKFRLGWRNIEWSNLTQLYPWSCYLCARASGKSFQWSYAFILWRLWSYTRPTAYRQDTVDNANRKETCYITNTFTLAKVQIAKVTEEIEANDLIKEKLNPYNKASIGETAIKTETGSTLHVRGKDSMIRGLHVGACLCDDMPDESSLYSDEQREKLKELLKGTIEPIVEPYGYFLVTGTPYSSAPNELYQILKADKRFYCFEYPILFPDGRPLAPDRYTFEQILAKKEELGTIVFNREYLVVPISDTSTIFPYEYLMRSVIGMETIRFASSIDDFPFKLTRVHIGVDFAVSGNIGADYTVYSVWGKDAMDNYYLLYYYRKRGMSHNEQVDKIVQLDRLFHPNKIRCEANGFQSILSGLAKERGLKNIEPFTTTEGNKKDLYTGLPSLSAMFERGQIKCPYAMGETRQAVDLMFGEFSSITFRSDNGKLEAASGHDDIALSSFLSINSLREDDKEVKISVDLI
nr:MAG TPA: Terminase large subunit [Caudoviricetes sp.]